jgi:branched-chain amino acid transport system substrate-binding protein
MINTKLRAPMALLVCAFLVTSCAGPGAASSGAAGSAPSGTPWKVGVITSFTGTANALGLEEIKSYRLAAKLVNAQGGVNGHPIELIEDDDQSTPQTTVTLVNKQISQDNVVGIVGGISSSAGLAVKPIVEEKHVPITCACVAVNVTADSPKFLFRGAPSDSAAALRTLDYAKTHSLTKVAVLFDSNAYGTGGKDLIVQLVGSKYPELKVVSTESYNNQDTDFSAQITKIMSLAPDMIVLVGTNPAPALAVKNARALGYKGLLFGGTGVVSPKTIEIAGSAAQGLLSIGYGDPDDPRPEQQPFIDEFTKEYGEAPVGFDYLGDGMYLMLEALKHVTADPSDLDAAREQLRDSMESNTSGLFWGIGPWNYSATDHDGAGADSLITLKVVDGEWKRES